MRRERVCRLHLGEPGKVGIAQNQTDIGVRDQSALAVDHVGATVLADLDLRHQVPNKLQVDLGDAHPGVSPSAGE